MMGNYDDMGICIHFYFYAKKDVHKTKQNFSLLHIAYNEISLAKPLSIHRVLRVLSTYQKNIRTLKYGFFGAKPHGEQRLLKAFCPLWENPANLFEKKPFGLLYKVLEGR